MANDKKFVVKNGLTTQNIEFVDQVGSANNTITVSMLSNDTLSFSGDTGQLFSITDSQSGTIFAVNDISGVPSIEVDDDGTIRFAEFDGNVLIGTDVDDGTNKLQISGSVSATSFSGDGSNLGNVDADQLDGLNSSQFLRSDTSDTMSGNLTITGNVGIGTSSPGEKLQVDGNLNLGGSSTENYIAFRGTSGDGPGSYSFTYIGERIYDGGEGSELFLAKLNDSSGGSNPDRIRLAGAELHFQTYNDNLGAGSFDSVANLNDFNTRMYIDSSGNVGIGTSSPSAKLDVNGSLNATDFNSTSDRNLKKDITKIENAVDKVLLINGYHFTYKDTEQRSVGVIAQEIEKVLPEVVSGVEGHKKVSYGNIVGLLIEAIKEQQKKIENLESRITNK